MANANSKFNKIRREAFEDVHKLVTQLEVTNWDKSDKEDEFTLGKDRAYREVIRILSNELNKY